MSGDQNDLTKPEEPARPATRKVGWLVFLPIVLACLASLALETLAASFCPVPQTDLFIGELIHRKVERAIQIGDKPKLVILAGSNGLFSHSCRVMEPIVYRPCVNASIAVGVGLDYMFAIWKPLLHAGDIVYMPMEPPQYTRTRAQNLVGPETRLLIHKQWRVLAQLSIDRELAAMLSVDLPTELRNLIAEPPLAERMHNIDIVATREVNPWGDRYGHTKEKADGANGKLDSIKATEPTAAEIDEGYGRILIARFVRWATDRRIQVIGGLATSFEDIPLSDATIDAMKAVYTQNGGQFLILPNHSRYPRHDFYDTRFHLYEGMQIEHSEAVARQLAPMIAPRQ